MTNLLFADSFLKTFVYVVGEETLSDISEKFNIPPTVIIADNGLSAPVREGMALLIRKRDYKTVTLLPTKMPEGELYKKLCRYNMCACLYPFQLVYADDTDFAD